MVEISRRNPGECIEGKDDAIAYLNAAAETGDPTLFAGCHRRCGQGAWVAKEAGVGRESLYKSLGKEGNPSFRTIVKVVNALGGRIVVESMSTGANGIRIKGSKVGLYKANGKALKTTGRDE
jgi:probable addiction module antidote protein